MKKRIEKLRVLMKENGLSHVLITEPDDIFYYTGYRTFGIVFLLISNSNARMFVFSVDSEALTTKGIDVSFIKNLNFLRTMKKVKKLGYDSLSMRARLYTRLRRFGIKMKDANDIIKKPRMIKDKKEIETIKYGVNLAGRILKKTTISGQERNVSRQIDIGIRENNCTNSFDTIVSAGKNGFYIHHKPSNNIIKKTDMVIVDFGLKYNGYCTDNTRTFCAKPGKREKEIEENIKNIQLTLADSIHDGVKTKDVQSMYEKMMKKNNYKVMHLFGHGVGLAVHEKLGDILKSNMIITIEPGVYIKNFGGYRYEDMFLIKKEKVKLLKLFK